MAWLLIGPLVAYALLALAGFQQLRSADPMALDKGGVGWFIMLFVIGVRNSWNLLVEANVASAR